MRNKKNTWKWNVVAIAAAVAATVATASAQDTPVRADVPFAFSINGSSNLDPGSYVVSQHGRLLWFRSEETGRAVPVVNTIALEGKADEAPTLTFICIGKRCYFHAVHAGYGARGVELPAPKLSKSDAEELATVNVPVEPVQAQ
jgi:hypothetical protein